MDITHVRADTLTLDQVARWSRLQKDNPLLQSPFFCPEYTQAVAAVQGDVYVGILQDGGRTVGFFPFHRTSKQIGCAVGVPMTDYHGIITEPGLQFSMREVLRGCRLSIWDFDYVPRTQKEFEPYHQIELESPIIDLSHGYESYLSAKYHRGSQIATLMYQSRKLAREVGPLRFVPHLPDINVLRMLIQWKVKQYQRTQAWNVFSSLWTISLLERFFATQSETFAGLLSVLYAGDNIVAIHFGIRSSQVWHYWFPVYDPQYASYSPGLLLLLKMAEGAESLGLHTIDFAHTDRVTYKDRFMNGSVPLWGGSVELPSWDTTARRIQKLSTHPAVALLRREVVGLVRHTPLHLPARHAKRLFYRVKESIRARGG
jgi:CelD/BcsL family acetyltransferase involved in cellulose biosynthesis